MAIYRYYTVDLATDVVVAEMPLYGVFCEKVLSGAGNFNGTFVLDTGDLDQLMLDGSQPGIHAMYVERDGIVVWAGPIWTRTYQSSSRTVQLTAQTYESVFEKMLIGVDQIYIDVDQNTILSTWLADVQANNVNCDFGITYSGPGATGVLRTIQLIAEERHFASELLAGGFIGAVDGMDYTINVASSTSKVFKAMYRGTAPADSGAVYHYPGQISNYWYSESASKGGINSAAIGRVDIRTGTSSTGGGDPRPVWWNVQHFTDLVDSDLLQAQADALAVMPYISPTFELSNSDDFDGWDKLGQTFTVNIGDARLSDVQVQARMTGWSLTPEQSENQEDLKLTLETDA